MKEHDTIKQENINYMLLNKYSYFESLEDMMTKKEYFNLIHKCNQSIYWECGKVMFHDPKNNNIITSRSLLVYQVLYNVGCTVTPLSEKLDMFMHAIVKKWCYTCWCIDEAYLIKPSIVMSIALKMFKKETCKRNLSYETFVNTMTTSELVVLMKKYI
jgi:hypothetical protein